MEKYEQPTVTVLGTVTDMTQTSKPGVYFDFGNCNQGTSGKPRSGGS
jgi:hypothetical protein